MTLKIVCDHCLEETDESYLNSLGSGVIESVASETVRLPKERSPHGRSPSIDLVLSASLPSDNSMVRPSHLCRECLLSAFRRWVGPEPEPA